MGWGVIRRLATLLSLGAVALLAACATPAPPPPPPAPVVEQPVFTQEGIASWYGPYHQGKTTANGETFDMEAMTAAHRTLPFNVIVRVTNLTNGKVTKVRVNDRGPYVRPRIIDLSAHAARALDMMEHGTARVKIEEYPSDQGLDLEAAAPGS